jgi:hypothetical protein
MTEPTTRSIPDPETSAQHIAQLRDFSALLREVSADLQTAIDQSNRHYEASPIGQYHVRRKSQKAQAPK